MSPLLEYCAGAVAALKSQYNMTKVLGHSATEGAARESLIQIFMKDHLPEITSVVSGTIVDANGNRSKQQDIVLILKSMPRLRFASGHDLIFQEGAVATFEIKTSIKNQTVIKNIGKNIGSVRFLHSTSLAGARLGDLTWPYDRILTSIVTYNGADLEVIRKWINILDENEKPDIYIDLARGIIMKNETVFEPPDNDKLKYFIINDNAIGLARFLTFISKITGIVQLRQINWAEYMK